jgi:small basic protein
MMIIPFGDALAGPAAAAPAVLFLGRSIVGAGIVGVIVAVDKARPVGSFEPTTTTAVSVRRVGIDVRTTGLAGPLRIDSAPSDEETPLYAALALVVGIVVGIWVQPSVPDWVAPYLPIAVIAALDALFGGLRAKLDGIFDSKVFVVSFTANVLVAAFIVFLGDQLGVGSQLSTAVVVVLGIRIFSNVAAIRRHIFKA